MHQLAFFLNGLALSLNPAPQVQGDQVAVPAEAFCALVGAELKDVDGQLAVCRGQLCVPLNQHQLKEVGQTLFVDLDHLAEPLGLSWDLTAEALRVEQTGAAPIGLGAGSPPPAFALPALAGGPPLGPRSFIGKKAVFYMWASW